MTFDANDPANLGRPLFWKLEQHVAAIEGMIKADELHIALDMCDRIPAWYLESHKRYPPELQAIKDKLHARTYSQIEYATDWEEGACEREFGESQADNGYQYPRLNILEQILGDGVPSWIFEVGMSHGNLPLSLKKHGVKFKYHGVGMNWQIVRKVRGWIEDVWQDLPAKGERTILYCTETLEHASREEDVLHECKKIGVDFDVILLSVPYCTLGGGLEGWDRRLGHVRTFNTKSFIQLADRFFPGYSWELTVHASMVLVGRK